MTYLLDVNLLIALCDPRHSHHEAAHAWFKKAPDWATCPITENGFVRISSGAAFSGGEGAVMDQIRLLGRFCSNSTHHFWPDSISLLDSNLWLSSGTLAASHVTDLYLLSLADAHGGKLASFDRRIPAHLVRGGKEALFLLPA